MKTAITIEIDSDNLTNYTDSHLALLWQVAQANPAPNGDYHAGDLAEKIGREIIRRWISNTQPELWNHQGRSYYWSELTKFAKYQPGGPTGTPEWHSGTWIPKADQSASPPSDPTDP